MSMRRPTRWVEGEGTMSRNDKGELRHTPPESRTRSMRGHTLRGNRDTPGPPAEERAGRPRKAQAEARHERTRGVGGAHSTEEAGEQGKLFGAEESVEGRRPVKGNTNRSTTPGTQRPDHVMSGLERVRQAATRKGQRLTALLHHVHAESLRESFKALKKDAASGVDGMTWREYEKDLEARLRDLKDRVHAGQYRAQPSRRVYIPKADGRMRPLGIAALEDKIVQHAVGRVLEAIYEKEFLGFSYGFRPGRNQHDALDALSVALTGPISWVLDADIEGFFDSINHERLMKFIELRIGDKRVLRLILKWLRAGVSEEGRWTRTTVGTPQGAVISPLLANIYLHYVLDVWVQTWRKKSARGRVIIVRYADDFVMGFQHRNEAEKFLEELGKRLQDFGLRLHPKKTRLIEFGRFATRERCKREQGKPETFDFLGFTHYCGITPGGKFVVKRKTNRRRLSARIRETATQLKSWRHHAIAQVGTWLKSVARGYLNYHAVPGNFKALDTFHREIGRAWFRSLRKRSDHAKNLSWKTMSGILKQWLPTPKILHPHPHARFAAKYPRQEPDAVAPQVRICPGGVW